MKIYLAGKIEPGDWREEIIAPELLRITEQEIVSLSPRVPGLCLPSRTKAIWVQFDYVGPFLFEDFTDFKLREEIKGRQGVLGINNADIIFVYADNPDKQISFDLGYAAGKEKKIWLAAGPAGVINIDPFLAIYCANRFYPTQNIKDPARFLRWFLEQEGYTCLSPIEIKFHKAAEQRIQGLHSQFPVGPYWIDFALPSLKLAIETDGYDFHKTKEQRTHDAQRDRYLTEKGWQVIRFTGSEIHQSVTRCVDQVQRMIYSRQAIKAE